MILALLLNKCAPELVPVLTKPSQLSYLTESFPDGWKNTRVQLIPKKRSMMKHPITNVLPISNFLEKISNSEMFRYLEKNNQIHYRQYKFRGIWSTADLPIRYVRHIWINATQSYPLLHRILLRLSNCCSMHRFCTNFLLMDSHLSGLLTSFAHLDRPDLVVLLQQQ